MDGTALPLAYLTSALVRAVAPACADPAGWVEPLRTACMRFEVNTRARLACFLAQVAHESGDLNTLSENLNYTVAGLRRTFPTRCPQWLAERIGRAPGRKADEYAIAEAVYSGRLGNVVRGDAFRFRGAGLIQLTGYANHNECAEFFDLPTIEIPEMLRTKDGAALGAAWYWRTRGCNPLADAGAFDGITRIINGGMNGADDRRSRYLSACRVLGL
jgi:putative chitinase